MENNLKKAVTKLLVLHLLSQKERCIPELVSEINKKSGGAVQIVFLYSSISWSEQCGYIIQSRKRTSYDERLRRYYRLTEEGLVHYKQLLEIYNRITKGVAAVLESPAGG